MEIGFDKHKVGFDKHKVGFDEHKVGLDEHKVGFDGLEIQLCEQETEQKHSPRHTSSGLLAVSLHLKIKKYLLL